MALPVARTPAEALLFLESLPCDTCGERRTGWRLATVLAVDGEAAERYTGVCAECGNDRDFVFAVADDPVAGPEVTRFGGPAPSMLLDAAQWLDVAIDAETAAADAVSDAESPEQAERDRRADLEYARDAVLEAMKFLPPGADSVPADAVFSDRGREVAATEDVWLTGDFMVSMLRSYEERLDEPSEGGP